jgi:hypothetical protein
MRSRLLIMSTAALLAGTLAAASQSIQPGGGAQEKGKPESSHSAMKSNASGREQTQGQAERGQELQKSKATGQAEKNNLKGKTEGQAQRDQDSLKGKTQGQAERGAENAKDNVKGKTQGQAERDQDKLKGPTQGQARQDEKKGQTEGQAQRDQDKQRPEQTQNQGSQDHVQGAQEGQRSGNTTVSFTTAQRTKIRDTVFKEKNAPRVSKVDFSLNVGTAVPRTVHIVEVPEVIVDIHPEWRGYRYFIVNDEVVIVEPDTLKIVAVIDV